MFRTRPPAFALACVAIWAMQLVVNIVLMVYADQLGRASAQRWQAFNLCATVVLGALLLVQLPRALQWRPRRGTRAGREVAQERQRIARDLHDHVGSQLVGAMALVDERDPAMRPLVLALERCMLDLRLVVDSMSCDDDALPDCLARLRHRIQPALDRRGIALAWNVAPPASAPCMPVGAHACELAAIAQEAVSNVLQHSSATAVSIALLPLDTPQGAAWRLQVADNGKGLPAAALSCHHAGQGLAGMRRRAAKAGGSLELIPAEGGGLCVQVTVPAKG